MSSVGPAYSEGVALWHLSRIDHKPWDFSAVAAAESFLVMVDIDNVAKCLKQTGWDYMETY
jgi:hypothetical protein